MPCRKLNFQYHSRSLLRLVWMHTTGKHLFSAAGSVLWICIHIFMCVCVFSQAASDEDAQSYFSSVTPSDASLLYHNEQPWDPHHKNIVVS